MTKILLVDDDPLLVRMYQTKLQNDGYEVVTAGNGEEALNRVEESKPDLILLDVMMPKMDGLQVLGKLKDNLDTKSIPVIMLSNVSSSDADSQKGLEMGATAYMVKSDYLPKEVVQKVKEILNAGEHKLPEVKVKMKDED